MNEHCKSCKKEGHCSYCGDKNRQFENKFCSIICADLYDGICTEAECRLSIRDDNGFGALKR